MNRRGKLKRILNNGSLLLCLSELFPHKALLNCQTYRFHTNLGLFYTTGISSSPRSNSYRHCTSSIVLGTWSVYCISFVYLVTRASFWLWRSKVLVSNFCLSTCMLCSLEYRLITDYIINYSTYLQELRVAEMLATDTDHKMIWIRIEEQYLLEVKAWCLIYVTSN